MTIDPERVLIDLQEMATIGKVRRVAHKGRSSRELSDQYEEIGVAGELAFEKWSGHLMDRTARPRGDTTDFLVNGWRVDIKTFARPENLLVEEGRVSQDVYVLAGYVAPDDDYNFTEVAVVRLLGWEWGKDVAKCPVQDFGYQIRNHYMGAYRLREMTTLLPALTARGPVEDHSVSSGKKVTPERLREIMLESDILTDTQRSRLERELQEIRADRGRTSQKQEMVRTADREWGGRD